MNDRHIHDVVRILKKDLGAEKLPIVTALAEREADPFAILISTLLSLRTKDEVTAEATDRLFQLASTPQEMLVLSEKEIIRAIYPVGFYRNKARTIHETCRVLIERFDSRVPDTIEELLTLRAGGKTIAELQNDMLSKVGEKIEIRRFQVVEARDGVVSAYTHLGNKLGVLVELQGPPGAANGVGRDVAMQVAAMNPLVVSRDQIGKEIVARELEVYMAQAKNEGKPDHIVEKIAAGRLEKFYQEVCLLEQTYIKDGGKTVRDVLQEEAQKAGTPIAVRRYLRYHLGEDVK